MTPKQFKTARERLGLTAKALAARLKTSLRSVQRYEQAEGKVSYRPVPGPVEVLMRLWVNQLKDK